MNFLKRLSDKIFGARKDSTGSGDAGNLGQGFTGWSGVPHGKRADFPSKAMRRGVSIARELKQKAKRLAFIATSQSQGIAIRTDFRKRQLIKREVRFKLREAVAPAYATAGYEPERDVYAEPPPIFCKPKRHAQSLWPKDKGQG